MTPEISVVVPVRDGEQPLRALLASLAAQDIAAERFEVVVVDNASRDGSASVAESYGARTVSEPVPNRSRARNAGVRAASADVIAFTDADCVASPGWLGALLDCRGRAPLVAGPVEVTTRSPAGAIERFESLWRFDQAAWVAQGWAATANLMVERSAFDAIGGFDSGYRHIGEDADFCLRAARAGLPIALCDQATVGHDAERELGPVFRRAFFHGYSAAQVARRLGVGHIAWRHPLPLLRPRRALAWLGVSPDSFEPAERRAFTALAWASYVARVGGSLWSALRRAR